MTENMMTICTNILSNVSEIPTLDKNETPSFVEGGRRYLAMQ
jgi:hypothetical protein